MRVERSLKDSAKRYGDKVGLVNNAVRLTYADLDRASDHLGGSLRGQGLARGDRVILFMDNSWEAVVSIFAILKAGAVFSPINPSTKADKLAFVLNNCRAKAMITQGRLLPIASAAVNDAPSIAFNVIAGQGEIGRIRNGHRFDEMISAANSGLIDTCTGIDLDLAMLIYTSGSTGRPKGVMMTHQNVVAAATSITTYLENVSDDVIMNVLPISFDYGLYQVLMSARIGATLILEKSFAFPQTILKKIDTEKVTGFPIVPTMAAFLLAMKDLKAGQYPNLRYITNTGAALPPAHIQRLQELFPTTKIFSMYGLTECKRATWLPPNQLHRRPRSVGIAIPGSEAYVVDDEGRRVPPGKIGELVIRGANVMKGYWENQEATDRVLRPGPYPWEKVLYTGDLFQTDEEGFLYFVGRKDDILKIRGEKVSPKEIEDVLYALKGIREAAVVGVPDPLLGTAIKAIIAVDPTVDLSAKEILHHCAAHLEDYMIPKYVEFSNELPKTDSGKISRREAASQLAETPR
jgi:amino acid adenylation domain-containing protein